MFNWKIDVCSLVATISIILLRSIKGTATMLRSSYRSVPGARQWQFLDRRNEPDIPLDIVTKWSRNYDSLLARPSDCRIRIRASTRLLNYCRKMARRCNLKWLINSKPNWSDKPLKFAITRAFLYPPLKCHFLSSLHFSNM